MTRAPQASAVSTLPDAELLAMLSMRRPAWSRTEARFIRLYLRPLGVQEDAFGNLYKRIGDAPVLWSSHTDTVHYEGGTQALRVANGLITQNDKRSNCLGADCTAGVWLMIQMIRAQRPGLYIFHRAEEVGGKGSSFIAAERPDLLAGITYAIAFDRRARHSIITHQGDRCCSEAFAASLSSALGMAHRPDSGGTFTDTANYTHAIGECSNLSVGYANEHTKRESLDYAYLAELRDALLRLDVSELVSQRAPGEADPDDYSFNWDDDDQVPSWLQRDTLLDLVKLNPEAVADWLEEYGIGVEDLSQAILARTGLVRR